MKDEIRNLEEAKDNTGYCIAYISNSLDDLIQDEVEYLVVSPEEVEYMIEQREKSIKQLEKEFEEI